MTGTHGYVLLFPATVNVNKVKRLFCCLLSLLTMFSYSGIEIWDSEKWDPPVLQGERPLIHDNRLYLLDLDGNKVKVYGIANGLKAPDFLWETPGMGQGPGEMNARKVGSLSVNPETGNLWLGHTRGLIVFDRSGKVQYQKKLSYSKYRYLPIGERLYTTTRRLYKECGVALKVFNRRAFLADPDSRPLFVTEALHQLAVFQDGGYITPQPSLFLFGSKVFLLDIAIGEVLMMDEKGNILEVHQLKHKDREHLIPVDYAPYRSSPKERVTVATHRNATPGLVKDGAHFWTITRYFDSHKDRLRNVITRFKMGEDAFSRFVIPGVGTRLAVIEKKENALLFFDLGEGHLFYRVDIESLKPFRAGEEI